MTKTRIFHPVTPPLPHQPEVAVSAASGGRRYVFIDALRGLAALAVVYLHMAGHLFTHDMIGNDFEAAVLWFFRRVIDMGKVGVVVFFAVSGFVIPFTLLKGGAAPVRNFVVNRFFRLYPAYWLSLALGLVFVWWLQQGQVPNTKTILMNITMLQQFAGVQNVLGLYWTLQIEMIFYALCVGLFVTALLTKRKVVFWIAIGMLGLSTLQAAARLVLDLKLPVALTLALAFMFWGCVWRDYVLEGNAEAKKLGWAFIAVFAVLMPLISVMAYNTDMGFDETWYRYLLSYYTAALMLVVGTTKIRLGGRFFAWLGKISYSVYLLSPIATAMVLVWVMPVLGREMPAHGYILLVMGLTMAMAHVCYHTLEAPCVRLGRHLNARWNSGDIVVTKRQ